MFRIILNIKGQFGGMEEGDEYKRTKKNAQTKFSNLMKKLKLPVKPIVLQFSVFKLDFATHNQYLDSLSSLGQFSPDPSAAGVGQLFHCWGSNFEIQPNQFLSYDLRMKIPFQGLVSHFPFLISGKLVEYYTSAIPAEKVEILYLLRKGDLSSEHCQRNLYIDTSIDHPLWPFPGIPQKIFLPTIHGSWSGTKSSLRWETATGPADRTGRLCCHPGCEMGSIWYPLRVVEMCTSAPSRRGKAFAAPVYNPACGSSPSPPLPPLSIPLHHPTTPLSQPSPHPPPPIPPHSPPPLVVVMMVVVMMVVVVVVEGVVVVAPNPDPNPQPLPQSTGPAQSGGDPSRGGTVDEVGSHTVDLAATSAGGGCLVVTPASNLGTPQSGGDHSAGGGCVVISASKIGTLR